MCASALGAKQLGLEIGRSWDLWPRFLLPQLGREWVESRQGQAPAPLTSMAGLLQSLAGEDETWGGGRWLQDSPQVQPRCLVADRRQLSARVRTYCKPSALSPAEFAVGEGKKPGLKHPLPADLIAAPCCAPGRPWGWRGSCPKCLSERAGAQLHPAACASVRSMCNRLPAPKGKTSSQPRPSPDTTCSYTG